MPIDNYWRLNENEERTPEKEKEVRDRIQRSLEEIQQNRRDKILASDKKPHPVYIIGDVIMIKNDKPKNAFDKRWKGPYIVVEQRGTTVIARGRNKPSDVKKVHVCKCVPAKEADKRKLLEGQYVVEQILQHMDEQNGRKYLIRWEGCGVNEDSWITEDQMDCPELLLEYETRLAAAMTGRVKKMTHDSEILIRMIQKSGTGKYLRNYQQMNVDNRIGRN